MPVFSCLMLIMLVRALSIFDLLPSAMLRIKNEALLRNQLGMILFAWIARIHLPEIRLLYLGKILGNDSYPHYPLLSLQATEQCINHQGRKGGVQACPNGQACQQGKGQTLRHQHQTHGETCALEGKESSHELLCTSNLHWMKCILYSYNIACILYIYIHKYICWF